MHEDNDHKREVLLRLIHHETDQQISYHRYINVWG